MRRLPETQLVASLRSLGRAHRPISALYLFGSQATGKNGPLSDIDVAVLLDERKVSPKRFFRFRLDLIAATTRVCQQPDVDVVILNEATPVLKYEVVRAGRLVYERDRSLRIEFEARAIQHYLDLEPFYRVSRSYLKRQLLSQHG